MLVLTRKKNQSIMLGDDVKITILDIRDDAISIGIDAPKNVPIVRTELLQAVREENLISIQSKDDSADLLKNLLKQRL